MPCTFRLQQVCVAVLRRKRGCCSQDGADAAKRFNGAVTAFAGSQEMSMA